MRIYLRDTGEKKVPGRGNSMYKGPVAGGRMGSHRTESSPMKPEDGEKRSDEATEISRSQTMPAFMGPVGI